MKRAIRRELKKKYGKYGLWVYHKLYTWREESKLTWREEQRFIGIYSKTRKPCSKPGCCGNPRHGGYGHSEKFTIQEQKALFTVISEEVEDYLLGDYLHPYEWETNYPEEDSDDYYKYGSFSKELSSEYLERPFRLHLTNLYIGYSDLFISYEHRYGDYNEYADPFG